MGVQRQRREGHAIATRLGWTMTGEFIDNNVSAARGSKKVRSHYQELLRGIERHDYDAVIVVFEDRLHRQVIELAEFIKVCEGAGVTRFASAGGQFDLSDADQRTMLYIKAAMAEAEVERMRARQLRKQHEFAEQGLPRSGGYRPFGEVGMGKHTTDEVRAKEERLLIHEAARRIMAGDTLRGIVKDWAKRGITTPTGALWRNVSLRLMLLSPRLIGMRSHNGVLYPGTWEPILERELWDAVRAILTDPSRVQLRHGAARYLLTGLLYCGRCQGRMTVLLRRRVNGKVPTYVCHKDRPGKECGNVSRLVEPLDALIVEAFFAAVESPEFYEHGATEDNLHQELYETLVKDQRLLDRLEDKLAQELISTAAYRRNKAAIEQRMEATRSQLERLGSERVRLHLPRNLREAWADFSLDRKRAALGAVIERIVVHPQRYRTFDPETVEVIWRS